MFKVTQSSHPSQANTQLINLAQGSATITDEGSGPPLVMIHGLPGSVRDFRWLVPCLTATYRIIRVDLPGFGGTPCQTSQGYSVEARMNFVMAILDTLNLNKVLLLAHSMGGPVAVATAAHYPERIVGLSLLATVSLKPHPILKKSYPKFFSFLLKQAVISSLIMPILRRGFIKSGFSKSISNQEIVMTMHYIGTLNFQKHNQYIQSLKSSTFVAWADDDRLIPTEFGQQLAMACPPGPRLRFATGGHNIQKTQAVELGEALTTWGKTLKF